MTTIEGPTASRWMGRRGEGYVVLQVALFLLVLAGPATWPGLPRLSLGPDWLSSGVAATLMVLGLVSMVAGGMGLGANLTPLPYPKDNGQLIESGIYAVVRHPDVRRRHLAGRVRRREGIPGGTLAVSAVPWIPRLSKARAQADPVRLVARTIH